MWGSDAWGTMIWGDLIDAMPLLSPVGVVVLAGLLVWTFHRATARK